MKKLVEQISMIGKPIRTKPVSPEFCEKLFDGSAELVPFTMMINFVTAKSKFGIDGEFTRPEGFCCPACKEHFEGEFVNGEHIRCSCGLQMQRVAELVACWK